MCGIMGYIGGRQAAPIILDGLSRLEYRGYDSAGLAILGSSGAFATHKAVGKLTSLMEALEGGVPAGVLGLGHTRWATHGPPIVSNAHPHLDCSGHVAVVQNGVVENYVALKNDLMARGHVFASQTDTEVIPHLIEEWIDKGMNLEDAIRRMLGVTDGALALLIADARRPDTMVAVRNGNVGGLVVGLGQDETFVASDIPALAPLTSRVMFMHAGEVAIVNADQVRLTTLTGEPVDRGVRDIAQSPITATKFEYKHFMQKEIMDQPEALTNAIRGRVDIDSPMLRLDELDNISEQLSGVRRVILTGCGTSYHAALVGRYYLESLTRLPVEVEISSELRYRDVAVGREDLVIALTQSGETADTLGAMEHLRQGTDLQIVITNSGHSESTRIAAATIDMRAGLEMGVAATKTFTSSIVCLYLLALHLGELTGSLPAEDLAQRLQDLARLPHLVDVALDGRDKIEQLANRYIGADHFLFMGRGAMYPIALEGALKLKEVSYVHAEGYAAGEMKHGPIALIDARMPTFALAPAGELKDKMAGNVEEIKARNGDIIGLLTTEDTTLVDRVDHALFVPEVPSPLLPIVAAVPMQLFAYYMGVQRGADVDQPRNLAKSVTVE